MDTIHTNLKPSKYLDDAKNLEIKENIETLNDNQLSKPQQNSSTTIRPTNNSNSILNEEAEENRNKQIQNKNSNIDTQEETLKNNGKTEENKRQAQIDLPFINFSKKRKNSLNYIRVRKIDVLPRNDIYEASDEDLEFIHSFNQQNNDLNLLTIEIFEQLIMLWENNSEKDYPISLPQGKSLIVDKLDKNLYSKIEDIFNVFKKFGKYFIC